MQKTLKTLALILIIPGFFFCAACGQGADDKKDVGKNDSLPPDLKTLNERIEADPDNALLYDMRAAYLLKNGKADEALSDVNKAIELDSDNPKFYRTLSDVYFSKGKVENCREALNKAVSIDDKDTLAYLKLAELEFFFKEYKKSFEFIDLALKIDARHPTAHFMRAMAFKELGDTAQAVKSLQVAVECNQDYYEAYIQLGLLHAAKHNPLAVDFYNNALNIRPESVEAYYNLGMYYQENQKYNDAIEAYTKLLKVDPNYKYAYFNLGFIHLVYLQVYDVAAQHFTKALNIDKNYAEAWFNRGYCYELLGNVMAAKNDYQQAIIVRPNYQKAIEGLNRVER